MASPPFNINQALPGDSDIVSQHPTNARSFRDIVESWLGVNHDTNGNHFRIDIPRSASPSTPAASVDTLYTSTTGRLKIKHPDGTEEFIGEQPGTVVWRAVASIPVGYLLADGALVSRATYPDLFAALGAYYSAGDGTTFGLPDLRGRVPVGADLGTARISVATMSSVLIGGFGGSETSLLVSSNIPSGVSVSIANNTIPVSVSSVSVSVSGSISGTSTGSTASGSGSGTASGGTVTGTASGTVSGSASVTSSLSSIVKNTGAIASQPAPGGGVQGIFADVTAVSMGSIASTGSISGSISGTSLSGSLSTPASVSVTFAGATVSSGTVAGSFSGSGTGTGSGVGTGTGTGVTTGTATAFSNMQPSYVLYPLVKT